MSMFRNYSDKNSVPMNIYSKVPQVLERIDTHEPDIEFDKCGNVIGLSWDSQDRFVLRLSTDFNILINENDIVLENDGEVPAASNLPVGTHAYNTKNRNCWIQTPFGWELLYDIEYPQDGTKIITFEYTGYSSCAEIKNFREETIYKVEFADNVIDINIDDELSKLLMQGTYNLDLFVRRDDFISQVRRIPVSVLGDDDNVLDRDKVVTGKFIDPPIVRVAKYFNGVIGNLEELKTSDKDSIVAAINDLVDASNNNPEPVEYDIPYFTNIEDATEAAKSAKEYGNELAEYYYGQKVLVDDGITCKWYTIQRNGILEAEGTSIVDSVEVLLEIDGDLYEFANAEEPELIEGTDTYSVTINQ